MSGWGYTHGGYGPGLSSPPFRGAPAASVAVAFVVTVPVNRALIAGGRGHAVAHQLHQ
jgi:hypothetical protein